MAEELIATFPKLPEGYWWKKELTQNFRGIRSRSGANEAGDGRCLFAIHYVGEGNVDDKVHTHGWVVFKGISRGGMLVQGLTAQEAVNFAYALFILGDHDG